MGTGRPKKKPPVGMPMLVQVPDVPAQIDHDEQARAVFIDACSSLIERGALSSIHIPTLAMYASRVAEFWRIQAIIDADGAVLNNTATGANKAHPLYNTLTMCVADAIRLGTKFGLFPVDAGKIAQAKDTSGNELTDILADD